MQLNEKEQRFITRRARLIRSWRYVGTLLLVMLIGLGAWLFFSRPLLANPFETMTLLKSHSIPASTLTVMAAILPVVVLMCIFLAVINVLYVFAAFSSEKQYLAIIQRESD